MAVRAYAPWPSPVLAWPRLAEFHVTDDLAAGRPVEVLGPYNSGNRVEIHALYPADHGVAAAARVRVFIDFLTSTTIPNWRSQWRSDFPTLTQRAARH
jgi:DNA-binding transcriptional LysR family regulator